MAQCPRMSRSVVINNLCGKAFLSSRICGKKFKEVAEANGVDFGCVLEIATISGIISIKRDMQTVLVKGVSNAAEMMQDLKYLTGNQDANPPLEMHMVVLSGCLRVVIDVSLGCLLEKTLQYWYKGLFVVICRHEEASNHMEIQSILSEETGALFLRVFNGNLEVERILRLSPCDMSLNISISRFGEMSATMGSKMALLTLPWVFGLLLFLSMVDVSLGGQEHKFAVVTRSNAKYETCLHNLLVSVFEQKMPRDWDFFIISDDIGVNETTGFPVQF
eukprot:3938937-Rhodomonas_salina.1